MNIVHRLSVLPSLDGIVSAHRIVPDGLGDPSLSALVQSLHPVARRAAPTNLTDSNIDRHADQDLLLPSIELEAIPSFSPNADELQD